MLWLKLGALCETLEESKYKKDRNSDISNVNEIKPYWYCNIEAHAVRIVSLNPKTIEIIHFDNYIQMVRSAIIMFTMLHTDTPC